MKKKIYNLGMIYTISINSSLDIMFVMENITLGEVNRSSYQCVNVGGKGNNVATVIRNMHCDDITPVSILAGFSGQYIEEYFKKNFRQYKVIYLEKGLTRFTANIQAQNETIINDNGPYISEEDFQRFLHLLDDVKDGDYVCISGSIPKCLGNNAYGRIMEYLKDRDVRICVDASGDNLLNTLSYHPFLTKPNLKELGDYFHVRIEARKDILKYMRLLKEKGVRNIICSLGKDGALMLCENDEIYYCNAPKGEVVSTLGAGDSLVGGFIYNYSLIQDCPSSLKYGVCCGSGTSFSEGYCTKEDVEELLKQTEVIRISQEEFL